MMGGTFSTSAGLGVNGFLRYQISHSQREIREHESFIRTQEDILKRTLSELSRHDMETYTRLYDEYNNSKIDYVNDLCSTKRSEDVSISEEIRNLSTQTEEIRDREIMYLVNNVARDRQLYDEIEEEIDDDDFEEDFDDEERSMEEELEKFSRHNLRFLVNFLRNQKNIEIRNMEQNTEGRENGDEKRKEEGDTENGDKEQNIEEREEGREKGRENNEGENTEQNFEKIE
jgi:hypothetical protein